MVLCLVSCFNLLDVVILIAIFYMYIHIAFVSPITIVIFTVIWPLATSVKMNKSNQIKSKVQGLFIYEDKLSAFHAISIAAIIQLWLVILLSALAFPFWGLVGLIIQPTDFPRIKL